MAIQFRRRTPEKGGNYYRITLPIKKEGVVTTYIVSTKELTEYYQQKIQGNVDWAARPEVTYRIIERDNGDKDPEILPATRKEAKKV